MPKIHIYSKSYCPFCKRAVELLKLKGFAYELFEISNDSDREEEMRRRSKRTTVPQIFIGDYHVGGCDDLFALDEKGQLDPLLNGTNS